MTTDSTRTHSLAKDRQIDTTLGTATGPMGSNVRPAKADVAALFERHSLLRIGMVVVELVLLIFVVKRLDILIARYRRLLYLVVPAFLANHLVPAAWRFRTFTTLSLVGLAFVLGDPPQAWRTFDVNLSIVNCLVVGGVGLAIIGICRVRLSFWARAMCLLLIAMSTMMLHVIGQGTRYWLATYTASAIFMVRTIPYLYEVSKPIGRATFGKTLAYFFVAHNGAMLNFPVMDFRTFVRSHYGDKELVLYQRGLMWMARGIFQLVLFRWTDRALTIEAGAVAGGFDLVRYLVYSYFRYLQVSGYMHFAIGLLLLFGFNMPETHRRYMLASSFTDFWQRINIYWKDFMQKVFFYPLFFRFKRHGHRRALVVATIAVFVVSWALHLWMAWWWTFSPHLSWTNSLMWASIGVLVAVNVLAEDRKAPVRTPRTQERTGRDAARLVVKTVGTFSVISVLMTLMYGPDPGAWCRMWTRADLQGVLWFIGLLAAVACAKVLMEILPEHGLTSRAGWPYLLARALRSDPVVFFATLALLYVASVMPWGRGVGVVG